ncbi:TlpA family protein disulfide reductase [Paenibacillus sp. FSL K6-2524]|uniref:TlpA family protein disulfide reductase n=1 Tax=Paenibacillus sp. FSL K6-2524 TaxID=2954516 RepID=UPI0030FA7203
MNRNRWIMVALVLLIGAALYGNSGKGLLSFLKANDKSEATLNQTSESLIANAAQGAPKPGTLSPEFSLVGLDGKTYQVGGKRDKPLLINFWASWCDPCKEEAPDLVTLANKYNDQLDVYAVNVTMYDKLDNVKKFVEQYGYTFPVLLDEKEEVFRKFNGAAFPTNVLVDKDGVIQDLIIGILPADELEAKLKKLLD